jgi:dienelactone hydrolase
MKLYLSASLATLLTLATTAFAEIKTATVAYKDGDTELEGFVAYDDTIKGPHPGVLIVHDWTGLQDYAKSRAKQIAELGYVAFAADIYGKGIRPTDPKDSAAQAGKYKGDLPLYRKRLLLALEQLKAQPGVDAKKLGAIGYCFGGTGALELARSGADVQGVVSFHGGLATTMPAQQGTLVASLLVCHGAADPYVKPEEVAAFKKEMEQAKAKLEFIAYPGAVHSFSNPGAGSDVSKGNAYQEKADKESWTAMKKFFADAFGK